MTPEQIAEHLVQTWEGQNKMQPLAWDFRGFAAEAARLAIAAERDACAKLCETAEILIDIDVWMGTKKALSAATAIGLANAIRKRSNAAVSGRGAATPEAKDDGCNASA